MYSLNIQIILLIKIIKIIKYFNKIKITILRKIIQYILMYTIIR